MNTVSTGPTIGGALIRAIAVAAFLYLFSELIEELRERTRVLAAQLRQAKEWEKEKLRQQWLDRI